MFFVKIFKRQFQVLSKTVGCTFLSFDFLSFILCFLAKEYSCVSTVRCGGQLSLPLVPLGVKRSSQEIFSNILTYIYDIPIFPLVSSGVKRSSQEIFSNILIYFYDDTTIPIFPLVSSGVKRSCHFDIAFNI